MARQYAGILGALAFLATVARAFVSGVGIESAMWSACLAMALFAMLGAVIGRLAAFIVDDAARSRLKREMEFRQTGAVPTATPN